MSFDPVAYNLFLKIISGENHLVMKAMETEKLDTEIFLNKFEWTPMHAAAYKGNVEIIKYLLSKGANVSAVNNSGYTPIMLAQRSGHKEVIEILSTALQNSPIKV
jgi:ankyrin repeat protein